jgi:predicted MFS family arabinose efflux permease
MQQYRGYKQLLASARFWAYACCMAFAIGTLYVFIGGAPIVAAQTTGISTTMVGVYLGLVPAGFMVGSFAAARYGARLTPLQLIVSGRLLTCAGLLIAGALAALQINHPIAFFGPCVCVGLGNGLTMPAANSRVLSVYAGLSGTALGLASAITTAGAGAIAFAAGLFVEATNARAYVLAAMFTTSLMSLAAAAFVVRLDSERSDAP